MRFAQQFVDSTAVEVRTGAGIAELAPQLIGQDPTQLALINPAMDSAMRGHP